MKRDLAVEIRSEQVKVFYRHARVVFIPNLVATPAILYVLWGEIASVALLAWGAGMYLVTGARALLVWVYGRRERTFEGNRQWGWRLAGMNMASGAMWGAAGFFFVSDAQPLSQAFVIITMAAMASGAVSSLSAFLPAYVMFAVPCVGALIVRMLLEWGGVSEGSGATYLMLAILSIVFLAVHLVFSRNTERALAESIRLRFEKEDLVEELTIQKERAEAASVAKSKFLAAASHDLRQPMHALGLFIDALRSEVQGHDAARLVDSVTESHQATTVLLDNLLEFSKVDAGIVTPAVASFPVQRLLDQISADYAVQASAADLQLRIRPCGAHVRSDPVLMARLLGNLVSNAIRYTEEGGVLVACRRRPGQLRIEVRDSGIGIPKEEQQAIFREFYQVADGVRRPRRDVGMGLGLAIVAGLAQTLGHPVSVSSTPGRGSVFSIEVPIGEPSPASEAPPAAMTDDLRGRTILVIDDEAPIREALAEVLRRWGCIAVTAPGGREAAQVCRARGDLPDAMLVDYQLDQGESGLDAIAHLHAQFGAPVPAIIVTGDTHPERLKEARRIGYLLLYKPLAPMRLRAALTACLQAAPAARRSPAPEATRA